MKVQCAWHLKNFGKEKVLKNVESEKEGISHGICKTCQVLLKLEILQSKINHLKR